MLFDILELNGQSLIKKPYEERRQILERPGTSPAWLAGPGAADLRRRSTRRDGDQQVSCELEGVVAKRRNSIYQPGRRAQTWLKIKLHRAQEVVIAGWRPGQGRRDGGVGSLLMGVPTRGGAALRRSGRLGLQRPPARRDPGQAGQAQPERPPADRRAARGRPRRALGHAVAGRRGDLRRAHRSGRLRHPVWRGLRPDKSPDEVVWERPPGT